MGHQRDYSEEVAGSRRRRGARAHRDRRTTRPGRSWSRTATSSTTSSSSCSRRRRSTRTQLAEIFEPVRKRPPRPVWLSSDRRPVSDRPPVVTPARSCAGRPTASGIAPRTRPPQPRVSPGRPTSATTLAGARADVTVGPLGDGCHEPARARRSPTYDHDRRRGGRPRAAGRDRRGPGPRRPARHPGPGGARVRARSSPACGRTPEDVLTTTFDLGHDEMVLVQDIEV